MFQVILPGLLLIPLLLKGWYVDQFITEYTAIRGVGFVQVLANDARIYAGLLLLILISLWQKTPHWLAVLFRLFAVIIFAVYIIDYLIITQFNTHLSLGDAIKYTAYAHKYIQQVYDLNGVGLAIIATLILLPVILLVTRKFPAVQFKQQRLSVFMITALPLVGNLSDQQKYAHSWIYKNVLDYNLTILSESAAYSPEFVNRFHYQETPVCSAITAETPNIIILMVESLSAYHSRLFSGINDWTPQLDRIASQNLAYKDFYANGFITEDGEIALLTGLHPIYPPSSYSDDGGTSFHSFFNTQASLPNVLKKQQYRSEFLTTADLEFGNTGNWAKSIGFDYVEGHEHADYEHWERFHFQAAPDEALYQRAIKRVAANKQQKLLMFIKTVSSHHPYVNPENKHQSESEVILYTDKQIGRFYQALTDSGFFDHGLLIIVGDHHSMTPLRKAEVELYGPFKAAAKVPLVVVGSGKTASMENRPFQQIDVFNTLQGLVAGEQCHTDWQGILWGERQTPPRFIAHRRGDNRDMVSVFTEKSDYLIKLDGDRTRLAEGTATDVTLSLKLIDKINALRISRSAAAGKTE